MNRQDAEVAKFVGSEPDAQLDQLTHAVIGAAIEVHRHLGPGLLESCYEEALCIELMLRKVPFARQVPLNVDYKQHRIGEMRLDLLIDGKLVLELKAVETLAPIHTAQLLSYLKIARLRLGVLVNFNVPELRRGIKRLINPLWTLTSGEPWSERSGSTAKQPR